MVRDPGRDRVPTSGPSIDTGTWTPRVDRLPYYEGPIPELGEAEPRNVEPLTLVGVPARLRPRRTGMILIGRYFSPFVRRVGTALAHYGIEFEHRPLRAAGDEQDVIRESSPLGRVPVLILDNGDVLSDSALILDYLDTLAPAARNASCRAPARRTGSGSSTR